MTDDTRSDNIDTLRALIFQAIRGVRDGSLDLDKARLINELSRTAVSTAQAETERMRVLESAAAGTDFLPQADDLGALSPGIVSVRQHRIRG